MKKSILTLLLLFCQTFLFAEGSALLVTLKDGKKAGYILSQKPSVTFEGAKLIIIVDDVSTDYDMADVSGFTFVDASEINEIKDLKHGDTLFEYLNGTIRSEGSDIHVYTLDGKLLKSGKSTISLIGQPSGVYVVKMNRQTIKIKK
jgi:hypothetical protein